MANYSQDVEKQELLEALDLHRNFLRFTARNLSDDQAAMRPTDSALSIGGLIKHVTRIESDWADFIVRGHVVNEDEPDWDSGFVMIPPETLESLLADYERAACETEAIVRGAIDLNTQWELPIEPWWPEPKSWSIRRTLLHILAETAQHAGHADIIRETIDGAKTMG